MILLIVKIFRNYQRFIIFSLKSMRGERGLLLIEKILIIMRGVVNKLKNILNYIHKE